MRPRAAIERSARSRGPRRARYTYRLPRVHAHSHSLSTMSTPRTLLLRSVPIVLLAAGAAAWLTSAAPARPNDTIEAAMGQINQSMKALGKGINAENSAAMLAELVKLEQALMSAKGETPDTAAAVDEKKRPEFVAEYRTSLIEALKFACDAELALVNGDTKEAESTLRKLGGLKSESHDKFKGKDEKGPKGGR